MSSQGYAVGLARAMFWKYGKTGVLAGVATGTQTTLSTGTTSGAYVMQTIKSSPFAYAQATELQITGGDRILSTPNWSNPRMTAFDVTAADIDSAATTLFNLAAVNTTSSYYTQYGYNDNKATPDVIGCAFQQRFETVTGFSYFKTRIVPRATATYHPGTMAYRAESDTVIRIAPITGTGTYDGQLYAATNLAFQAEQDKVSYYDIDSADPFHIITFCGDGTGTTINLPYRPLSTVVAINVTPNQLVIVNPSTGAATITALSAITTGTGATASLAAAGTSAALNVVTYSTNFIPS
jgi:hypothetical protein